MLEFWTKLQNLIQILLAGVPMAPFKVRIEKTCSTWVKVTWEHSEENVTFEVTYETKNSTLSKVSNIKFNHLVIWGLKADTKYQIVVRAANEIGYGKPSTPLTFVNKTTVNFSLQALHDDFLSADSSWIYIAALSVNLCIFVLSANILIRFGRVKNAHVESIKFVKFNKGSCDEEDEEASASCNIYLEVLEN